MSERLVRDVMLPLSDYAVVSREATLLEALEALDLAQAKLPPDKMPHRAVLVKDESGKIVGKLGHLAFLKAILPHSRDLGNLEKLAFAGVSEGMIEAVMESLRLLQDDFSTICHRAQTIKVKDAMKQVEESVDENATLVEAINRIVMHQTLSILVKRGGEVVGILRLSDLFTVVKELIRSDICN